MPLPDHGFSRVSEARVLLRHGVAFGNANELGLLMQMLALALDLALMLTPLVVGLAVVLPRRRLPRRELDLEAVVDVVDHGARARHGLHRRVRDLEALLQVASNGVGGVEVLVGGPPPGEPAAAQPADNAGGHGEEGDHREHGEDRAERALGRRGGGRLRAQDGVRGRGVVYRGIRQGSHVLGWFSQATTTTTLSLEEMATPLLSLWL